MPDMVDVHDGGEAPHAANALTNPMVALTVATADIMNLNGGQAPASGGGGEMPRVASAELTATHSGSEMAAPPPPIGGAVHGP